MNTPLVTVRITLFTLLFVTQQSCGMELIAYGKQWIMKKLYGETVPQFGKFPELPKEVQLLIFKHSDNKPNFQQINKDWHEKGSIESPELINEFYRLGSQRMCRIFLNAIYTKNYNGVENILKHYYAQQPDYKYCLPVDINEYTQELIVLDPYDIADEDEKMTQLLKEYKIAVAEASVDPIPLFMACLSGCSDFIECSWLSFCKDIDYEIDETDMKRALNITVDCDHSKCMQQLINIDSIRGTLFSKNRDVFGRKLLRRACINKRYKTLEVILSSGYCSISQVVNYATILDEILEVVRQDDSFTPVVALLKKYGAKTAQRLIESAENDKNWRVHSGIYF